MPEDMYLAIGGPITAANFYLGHGETGQVRTLLVETLGTWSRRATFTGTLGRGTRRATTTRLPGSPSTPGHIYSSYEEPDHDGSLLLGPRGFRPRRPNSTQAMV